MLEINLSPLEEKQVLFSTSRFFSRKDLLHFNMFVGMCTWVRVPVEARRHWVLGK